MDVSNDKPRANNQNAKGNDKEENNEMLSFDKELFGEPSQGEQIENEQDDGQSGKRSTFLAMSKQLKSIKGSVS